MQTRAISLTALGLLGALACKPPTQTAAHVASLNNLSGDGKTDNICSGLSDDSTYDNHIDVSSVTNVGRARALKALVSATLTAAPAVLKQAFFQNGSIKVTSDAAKICANALTPDERRFAGEGGPVLACWTGAATVAPQIVLADDAATISHNTLRMLAYLVTGGYSPAVDALSGAQRTRYATTVRANDAFKAKELTVFNTFAAEAKSDTFRQAQKSGDANLIAAAMHEVYSEALDSYFCSDATRAQFQAQYPRTLAVFAPAGGIAGANPNAGASGLALDGLADFVGGLLGGALTYFASGPGALPTNGIPTNGLPTNGLPTNGLPTNGTGAASLTGDPNLDAIVVNSCIVQGGGCHSSQGTSQGGGPAQAYDQQGGLSADINEVGSVQFAAMLGGQGELMPPASSGITLTQAQITALNTYAAQVNGGTPGTPPAGTTGGTTTTGTTDPNAGAGAPPPPGGATGSSGVTSSSGAVITTP